MEVIPYSISDYRSEPSKFQLTSEIIDNCVRYVRNSLGDSS